MSGPVEDKMGGKPKKPKEKGPSKAELELLEKQRQADLRRFQASQLRRTILAPAATVARRDKVGASP